MISFNTIIVQMGKPRPREGEGHAELRWRLLLWGQRDLIWVWIKFFNFWQWGLGQVICLPEPQFPHLYMGLLRGQSETASMKAYVCNLSRDRSPVKVRSFLSPSVLHASGRSGECWEGWRLEAPFSPWLTSLPL